MYIFHIRLNICTLYHIAVNRVLDVNDVLDTFSQGRTCEAGCISLLLSPHIYLIT